MGLPITNCRNWSRLLSLLARARDFGVLGNIAQVNKIPKSRSLDKTRRLAWISYLESIPCDLLSPKLCTHPLLASPVQLLLTLITGCPATHLEFPTYVSGCLASSSLFLWHLQAVVSWTWFLVFSPLLSSNHIYPLHDCTQLHPQRSICIPDATTQLSPKHSLSICLATHGNV